jgi:hypothetical protein
MSPEEQLSEDEYKGQALKLIQQTWKNITSEKEKGSDVGAAEEKIIEARKAIKDKDFKRAYENAQEGNFELNKVLGGGAVVPDVAAPRPDKEGAEELAPTAPEEPQMHEHKASAFAFSGEEAPTMPEPKAEEILGAPEEKVEKPPAPPKPMLFLCFNCNEPISVTVAERPLIVKCPNCGIDGQID